MPAKLVLYCDLPTLRLQRFAHVSPPSRSLTPVASADASLIPASEPASRRSAAADPAPRAEADTDQPAPAHIAIVDGTATLERDGRPESGLLNMPLMSGDRLRTTTGASRSSSPTAARCTWMRRRPIDVQSDELVRLLDGRVRLTILGPARDQSRIGSTRPPASVRHHAAWRLPRGAARTASGETQLELAVLRGAADIFTRPGTTPVARRSSAPTPARGSRRRTPTPSTPPRWDAFDQWSRTSAVTQRGVSAQYLAA